MTSFLATDPPFMCPETLSGGRPGRADVGRRRKAVLLEVGTFQDNKSFKYVYIEKKSRKDGLENLCLLFGTAPNSVYFLESLYVWSAGCIETNEAPEVKKARRE